MKTTRRITHTAFATLALSVMFQTPITRAADQPQSSPTTEHPNHAPRHITFEKCVDPTHVFAFVGTVTGDCGPGQITFNYLGVLPGNPIVRFAGEYKITTAECTITAVCAGPLNLQNGDIVLSGVVTGGPLLGDSVQLKAQLSADGQCSAGTIKVTPCVRE